MTTPIDNQLNYYFAALNAWTDAPIVLLQTKQWLAYIYSMPSKPIELPPAVARRFLEDMRAFFAQESPIKRDEIAGRQITDFPLNRNPARAGVLERGSRRFA